MKLCLDACTLYPTVLREIVMGVADAGLITPIWSARIFEEWARAALKNGGAGDETIARGEIAMLRATYPEAEIANAPTLEAQLWLPDPNDIHVLASAIAGGAEAILTLNLKDFPRRELEGHALQALHPDAYLYGLWMDHPAKIEQITRSVHHRFESLAGQTMSLRALMKRARLPRLGKALDS